MAKKKQPDQPLASGYPSITRAHEPEGPPGTSATPRQPLPLPNDQGGPLGCSPAFLCSGWQAVTFEPDSPLGQIVRSWEAAQAQGMAAPPANTTGIDDEDLRILAALKKVFPLLQTLEQIEAASGVSCKTISKRIPDLLKAGLVERPKGPKSGTKITQIGLNFLKQIDRTKSTR